MLRFFRAVRKIFGAVRIGLPKVMLSVDSVPCQSASTSSSSESIEVGGSNRICAKGNHVDCLMR